MIQRKSDKKVQQQAPTFGKETLLKSHINTHTLIAGDVNIPLSPTERSSRQKLSREMLELSDKPNGPYRYYRTFSKIEHILDTKEVSKI